MANPVQRLRYFDGEYLRSYDFTDEQSYHIAMRRLMNRRLHLHGIVYGLEIMQDQDSVPSSGIYSYSISPGMAIDQTGREIIVTAPYSLTNVLKRSGVERRLLRGVDLLPGERDWTACRRLSRLQRQEPVHPLAGVISGDVKAPQRVQASSRTAAAYGWASSI